MDAFGRRIPLRIRRAWRGSIDNEVIEPELVRFEASGLGGITFAGLGRRYGIPRLADDEGDVARPPDNIVEPVEIAGRFLGGFRLLSESYCVPTIPETPWQSMFMSSSEDWLTP